MSSTTATQRCPRCGNEVRSDSYSCAFCGKRLRVEFIEQTPIFQRIEREWYAPFSFYKKLMYLFINPPLAMWDINHKRQESPGKRILLFSSLAWGLIGLAIYSHITFGSSLVSFGGMVGNLLKLLSGFLFFLFFFLFGYIFQNIFFSILIKLYTKGADYAVNYSERLEQRFGLGGGEGGKSFDEKDLSPFSIYRGGVLLQTQRAYRKEMMLSAFAPYLVVNLVKALLLFIMLPNVSVASGVTSTTISMLVSSDMLVWKIVHLIDFLTLAIWVPYLVSICIRELSNSGTWKVLVSSIIISVLAGFIFYLLRPTLLGSVI